MIRFNSINELKKYCFNTHSSYLKNNHFRKWINNKEIHIFNFSNLRKEDIKHIKSGIEDAIAIVRLHFKVYFNNESSIKKFSNLTDEKIDSRKLLKMVIEERKKSHKEHSDAFIFNNPIKSTNAVLRDGESLTYVPQGVMIFTFDAFKKYPHDFLSRRAKHEALHLLGLNFHHEGTKIEGYDNNILCNMNYNAPTQHLCRKCKDAIVYFWKGIEYATTKQFIKN